MFPIKLLFIFTVLFRNHVTPLHHDHHDFFRHDHFDDDYDDTTSSSSEELSEEKTDRPIARYEVTEYVIDVPNTENNFGPVITNFTIPRPLNNATQPNKDRYNIENGKEKIDTDKNKDKMDKLKKNYLSIFHVKAEYDDDIPKIDFVQNINVNKFPTIPTIKEYIHGVKEGFVNGINSLVHRDVYSEVNSGFNLPNIVAKPVHFLNKLHKKSSDVAHKIHNAVFGHKFDDE